MHFFMHEILKYKFVVNELLIDRSQNPPTLSYCCYAQHTMPLSHYTCSHAVKNTLQSKEETDNTPTEKTEQVTSGMKQGLRTLSF